MHDGRSFKKKSLKLLDDAEITIELLRLTGIKLVKSINLKDKIGAF